MNHVVEYRNLTFASSDDGALQIWFEARCDLDFLCAPLMTPNGRGLLFERITPQLLTGWALYRTGNAKEDSKGDIVSLRPHGSGGSGSLTAVERHLRLAKQIERNLLLDASAVQAVRGKIGEALTPDILDAVAAMRLCGDLIDKIMSELHGRGGENAE